MVFGRGDWVMFVSMYSCLFREVATGWPSKHEQLLKMMEAGPFEGALQTSRHTLRVTPAPYGVVELLTLGPDPTPRVSPAQRASKKCKTAWPFASTRGCRVGSSVCFAPRCNACRDWDSCMGVHESWQSSGSADGTRVAFLSLMRGM